MRVSDNLIQYNLLIYNVRNNGLGYLHHTDMNNVPAPVAARSKAYVCSRSPAEIVGSNPTAAIDICLL